MIRFLFALYSALAVPVLVLAVGIPEKAFAFEAILEGFLKPDVIWVTAGAALLVFSLFLLESLLSPINKRGLRAGVYTCFAFLVPLLGVAIMLRLGFYFIFDGLIYSPVLGTIGGLLRYNEDLTFLSSPFSEGTKRARLDKAYDLAARGLTIFTTLYFAGLVGSAVSWAFRGGPADRIVEYVSIAVVIGYLTAGVIPGVYLRLFRKLQELKDSYASPEEGKIILQ